MLHWTPAKTSIPTVPIIGIPIACTDMAGMTTEIARYFDSRTPDTRGAYICFRDVHGVVLAHEDPVYMRAHLDAFLVVADGKPLATLARIRGNRSIRQVRGIESLPRVCEAGVDRGWRHYFLGGAPGVADELAAEMTCRFPGLTVAGTESPPFRPLSDAEIDTMVDRINAARPDIVWVGLGSPKQEIWMANIAHRLNGAMCLGVGAAFDIHTGRVVEAPAWIRRLGVEWAFRISQEPRRLARRYLHAIPRFLALVALERWRGY